MMMTELRTMITATAHAGICLSIKTVGVAGGGLLLVIV